MIDQSFSWFPFLAWSSFYIPRYQYIRPFLIFQVIRQQPSENYQVSTRHLRRSTHSQWKIITQVLTQVLKSQQRQGINKILFQLNNWLLLTNDLLKAVVWNYSSVYVKPFFKNILENITTQDLTLFQAIQFQKHLLNSYFALEFFFSFLILHVETLNILVMHCCLQDKSKI